MAVINLIINDEMKEEFLNDWKNGDVYLLISANGFIIGSKDIAFDDATSYGGTSKIEWIPSGTSGDNGSDFEIPVGTTITDIGLYANGTVIEPEYTYARIDINEEFTYGGIIRIDKITITLT